MAKIKNIYLIIACSLYMPKKRLKNHTCCTRSSIIRYYGGIYFSHPLLSLSDMYIYMSDNFVSACLIFEYHVSISIS